MIIITTNDYYSVYCDSTCATSALGSNLNTESFTSYKYISDTCNYTDKDDAHCEINNTVSDKSEKHKNANIKDIAVIVPDKVVLVKFVDGGKEKMVCHQDDAFDLRKCLFIAIAKHLYKDTYTFEGLEVVAEHITYLKEYVKIVDKAMKSYKKKLKREEEMKAKEAESKLIAKNRRERQARKSAKRKEAAINIQKEAYIRAIKELELDVKS